MSVLSGVPSGASIKPLQIVSGSSVVLTGNTAAYVGYGLSRVSFTLSDGKNDDADVTVDIDIKHNYLKGPFYASFNVGDKFWVTHPEAPGSIWGSNPYHVSSNMVMVAKHAGLLKTQSPHHLVTISKKEWKPSFTGSTANGVTSFSGNQAGTAFTLA